MSRKCRSHILQRILLTVQDLSKAYYQISSIILLYEFIRLSVNMKVTITNVRHLELNTKIVSAFLNS